jgi:hypothetical protein
MSLTTKDKRFHYAILQMKENEMILETFPSRTRGSSSPVKFQLTKKKKKMK